MTIRIAIRGFVNGKKQFEETVEVAVDAQEDILPGLAIKHAAALAAHEHHMIEIEFLDEPNPLERFVRFGTDPSAMVLPIGIKLRGTS